MLANDQQFTIHFYMATSPKLNAKIPDGPLETKWTKYRSTVPLVNPANKRKLEIIVVGTGLAGASAAATLAELGYSVKAFCFQDSARRAHSIAAQGGINAAKNYQNDGDSTYRLFYDTIKGGDYRARESNVYRLAEVSAGIIDQCVAQGFLLPVNTAACFQTALLEERRCSVHSTRQVKLDSSCCWALIQASSVRWV